MMRQIYEFILKCARLLVKNSVFRRLKANFCFFMDDGFTKFWYK